jgi:hypothetical protein
LYENHQLSLAREVFDELRVRDPGRVGNRSFERFVREEFTAQVAQMNQPQAQQLVEATLFQSCMWLALGQADRATGLAQKARLFYDRYRESLGGPQHEQRAGLPPFDLLRQQACDRALQRLKSAPARERLEKARQPGTP